MQSISERLVNGLSRKAKHAGTDRRSFLGGAAVVGAALAVNPWGFLVRPASAYSAVCGTAPNCADGYSVFCCSINGGNNSCPPDSFIGGWWKADSSSFCGGSARYYIDCNAFRDGHWTCHCGQGSCDQRRVACNQFRYGQCSLHIPYSQTGPVVCRIVSCTPPWQQYAGLCTSSSATDNSTGTQTAPCVGQPPKGSFDGAVVSGSSVRVTGWAYDPDRPTSATAVAVAVDGVGVGNFPTGRPRADVNRAFGIDGDHGFDVTVAARPGVHTVAVTALNVAGGPGNSLLGSRHVTVAPPPGRLPIGRVDSVTGSPNTGMRVRGWAFDADVPGSAIKVAVYRDGVGVAWFPTGRPRPDVNSAYRIAGAHGFDITIPAATGRHTVQVYAINAGGGRGNPLIGTGSAAVLGLPFGHLDIGVGHSGTAVLRGWAIDPDNSAAPIAVEVYRDGLGVGRFPTGGLRPDVNLAYGIRGAHGFEIPIRSAPGRHTFAVHAINIGPAGSNPLIGTRTVVVPA